jgi:hypothetical protein
MPPCSDSWLLDVMATYLAIDGEEVQALLCNLLPSISRSMVHLASRD